MAKKLFTLTALLLVFASLFSGISYAGTSSFSGFDVSIDRVTANGNVVTESRSNLMDDANAFSVIAEFTAVRALDDGHVEAVLRGRQSGDVVSDATGTFDMFEGQNSIVLLNLVLTDGLKREDEFDLTVKIVDIRGNSEQKTYGIKTRDTRTRGRLDVSIDRVFVNNKVVAESRTNFIEESNDFDVLVEFTALEDLEDARVEAILKDLRSGNVVADASSNFDLSQDSSSSILLSLELLDKLKDSSSFELAVRIADAEGDSVQKVYGLRMKDGNGNGVSGGGSSRNLDISVDSVEVESRVVAENENNFVVIGESKKELDLRVRLTSLEDIEDAHIDAVLAFENGDVVADATAVFDISEGENTVKKLELPLIGSFEQNSFKLKVRVVDAEGDSEEKVYGLKISKKRFPFVISSISLSPESNAEAGKNLIAKVRFRNSGVVPLDGVNVKVSIPELGVSASKFADSIEGFGTEASEEFVLKILDNTPTGTYTLRSEVTSQFGSESEVKEIPVFILGKGDQEKQIVNDRLLINVPVLKQSMKNDGTEAIYPIMLTNNGPDANSYTLLLDGGDWAGFRLSDSNTFVLEPKESKTINVYASATAASKGEQIFVATIKSNDRELKQIPLKANVVEGKGLLAANLKNILGVLLIGFVVLLVAVALFFGVKRLVQGSGSEEEAQEEMQAYY
ncbi:hypothetical protein HYT53_02280 [Candidatus Woesearchaeota archaeon]|nr:hypothetical protein [Candidatus Woesearchaeota archaeon]